MGIRAPQKPEGMSWDRWRAWPKCGIPACEAKACIRLRSIYCWPHTPALGLPTLGLDEVADSLREEIENGLWPWRRHA